MTDVVTSTATTRDACRDLLTQLDGLASLRRTMAKSLPAGSLPAGIGVLAALSRCGTMRTGQLAELLEVDMSTVSRHIAHVEANGWVERLPNPADRRSCLLQLTVGGREVLDVAVSRSVDHLTGALGEWTLGDTELLTSLLTRLKASLGTPAGPPAGAAYSDTITGPTSSPTKRKSQSKPPV